MKHEHGIYNRELDLTRRPPFLLRMDSLGTDVDASQECRQKRINKQNQAEVLEADKTHQSCRSHPRNTSSLQVARENATRLLANSEQTSDVDAG